jgi:hypothetical protein
LLTAAFSLYLSVQQSEIKEKQDEFALFVTTKAETEKWAERTLSYVEKLSMPDSKQKEAIVINLLDAIAVANANQQGTTDRQKILHTPLWIALATGNVEALGLIGNADNRREVWFNLANGSGDATVRKTAMEALANSSASTPLNHLLEIYELSEQLNNGDILDSSIEQINRVVRVMERDPDPARFREEDRVKPLVARLEVLHTNLAADAAALAGDPKTVEERRATLQRETQGVERALAFLRGSAIAVAGSAPPMPGATPEASMPKADVQSLIEGLKSPDAGTRRESRETLANVNDPKVVSQLLAEFLTDKMSYRVKLGVASALYQAKRVILSEQDQVRAVVDLIGDDDVLIRKYASESLMKLTDPGTVQLVHGELRRIIENRAAASPNAVYNAVVVLGTWMRILPPSFQAERTSISSELMTLKSQVENEPNWTNTSALIDEMLRLNVATRQTGASAGDRP